MRVPDYLNGIELFEIDIYEEDMKQDDVCWGCGAACQTRYDEKYHGWRGYCPDCGTNWPLS